MRRTFLLLSALARILFALFITFDFLLVARLSGEFATNGRSGVRAWILHMGAAGRGTVVPPGSGLFVVHAPPPGPIFREFFILCGALLVLTPLSYWLGRVFGRLARKSGEAHAIPS
jgi:hypothetical protein